VTPAGFTLVPVVTFDLKGISQPVMIYEAVRGDAG
jgi:hypothetical protein